MNVLFAGFEGKNNSSKKLLDYIDSNNKLYLKNDKKISCEQIEKVIENNDYDAIFLFGQKPIIKDKLSIEKFAKNDNDLVETNFDINELEDYLKENNINYYLSEKAGNSYCNNIYYHVLRLVKVKKSKYQSYFCTYTLFK